MTKTIQELRIEMLDNEAKKLATKAVKKVQDRKAAGGYSAKRKNDPARHSLYKERQRISM